MKKSILVFALIFISLSLYAKTKPSKDASDEIASALAKLSSKGQSYKNENFTVNGPSFNSTTEGAFTKLDQEKETAEKKLKLTADKLATKPPQK